MSALKSGVQDACYGSTLVKARGRGWDWVEREVKMQGGVTKLQPKVGTLIEMPLLCWGTGFRLSWGGAGQGRRR